MARQLCDAVDLATTPGGTVVTLHMALPGEAGDGLSGAGRSAADVSGWAG
jgi:hypothetical protein